MRPDIHRVGGAQCSDGEQRAVDNGADPEVTFDQISELARWLFSLQNPGAVFAAEDEMTRLFWRKQAQRKLQEQRRYKKSAENA
jgi:hypothetical protein